MSSTVASHSRAAGSSITGRIRQGNAFTIIEVMVALIIVGVLLAIAIPLYAASRKNVQQKACEANMSAIFQAEEAYRVRNRAYTNTASNLTSTMGGLPTCPNGTAAYVITTSGSGASQTVKIECPNQGAHVSGKYHVFDSSTMTYVDQTTIP